MQKEHRLAKREDFNRVYRRGKSVANMQFVVYVLPQKVQGPFRLGVSVSKKLGNAVVRNRLRRMMKEIVRTNQEDFITGVDFVVIARKPVVDMDFEEMKKCLFHALKKATLFKDKRSSN